VSAGPTWPPVWNAARPTPAGEVIAQATACSNGVTPRAAMMPPTLSAPVSTRVSTASFRYPGGRSACPSTRATTGNRDALMAALLPAGIRPFGLSTTVTRESALEELERDAPPQFSLLRDTAYESYYTQPAIWKLIGYVPYPTDHQGPHLKPFDETLLADVRNRPKLYREA